ncbi:MULTISPECIES: hypothetical protein [unclassified Streptomyces]
MQTLLPYLITFAGSGTAPAAYQEVRQQAERKMATGAPRPKK